MWREVEEKEGRKKKDVGNTGAGFGSLVGVWNLLTQPKHKIFTLP